MIRAQHFLAVLAARNREFLRDRSSWAWNVFFPFLLIAGLAVMFGSDNRPVYKVAVFAAAAGNQQQSAAEAFFETRHINFVDVPAIEPVITKVERHQYDLLLDTSTRRYWVNTTSPNGYLAEQLLIRDVATADYQRQPVSGKAVRYVDWVLPGILGMNMMFSCLFGVGYVIVRYRKSGVLKRLKATPLRAVEFLAAQVVSRLWLVLAITLVVYLGSHLMLRFVMHGNYLTLLLVLTLGSVCLINLGLLVAARTSSEELAGGMLNLFTWPMMIMSGVWFSLEGTPQWLQWISQLLPLTHIVDACRAIMIDGAGLLDIGWNLGYLALTSVLFLALGAWLFRWE